MATKMNKQCRNRRKSQIFIRINKIVYIIVTIRFKLSTRQTSLCINLAKFAETDSDTQDQNPKYHKLIKHRNFDEIIIVMQTPYFLHCRFVAICTKKYHNNTGTTKVKNDKKYFTVSMAIDTALRDYKNTGLDKFTKYY